MTDETLLALALAIQQAANALVNLLQQGQPPACAHRERRDLTTFGGGEHWICTDCGYEYQEVEHAEDKNGA